MIKIYLSLFFLLPFFCRAFAQQLTGRILKKGSPAILAGVNVRNMSSDNHNSSDMGGNYRIVASAGDTLIFSSAGYRPDTIFTSNAMLVHEYDIYLTPNIVALPAVEIDAMSKYEKDSVSRMEEYAFILNRKHPVKLVNEKIPYDKPGFIFSPISFFSTREKQKRKLIKRLKEEDENEYIDTRFPRSRVAQVTRLTSDSLQQFMILYRPGYSFCRNATNQDLLLYINDKLILFRKIKKRNALP